MRQLDPQKAPPLNQNREMSSASDDLTEELQTALSTTPVVCPSYPPGLAPHQRTSAPEPTGRRHANPFPLPLLASDLKGVKTKNGGRGDACEVGFVVWALLEIGGWWRFGGGILVVLFEGVVGGGDLVVASCLVQNNDSKRKTAI